MEKTAIFPYETPSFADSDSDAINICVSLHCIIPSPEVSVSVIQGVPTYYGLRIEVDSRKKHIIMFIGKLGIRARFVAPAN